MKYCQLCRAEYPDELDVCPVDGLQLLVPGQRDGLVGVHLKKAYEIQALIGAGGMGRVYRAMQRTLQRPVAIKLIKSNADAPGLVKQFYHEARILGRIHHANVVTIHDIGNTDDGAVFLVMELLEGDVLSQVVPRGHGLSIPRAIELFDQICSGVGAAHSVGVVHRDLKPSNIFYAVQSGGSRVVKVMDFGLAKVLDTSTSLMTGSGFFGTPGYVAPELIGQSSSLSNVRSDIYALGAVLYFLLTGEEVQGGGTSQEILARQLMEKLDLDALAGRSDLHPKLLRMLILKAMSLDPADRHESCEALLQAFRFATAR